MEYLVARVVRENTGWVKPGWVATGYAAEEPALRVYLTEDEATKLGRDTADVDALWLAARVLEFWQARPALHMRP